MKRRDLIKSRRLLIIFNFFCLVLSLIVFSAVQLHIVNYILQCKGFKFLYNGIFNLNILSLQSKAYVPGYGAHIVFARMYTDQPGPFISFNGNKNIVQADVLRLSCQPRAAGTSGNRYYAGFFQRTKKIPYYNRIYACAC